MVHLISRVVNVRLCPTADDLSGTLDVESFQRDGLLRIDGVLSATGWTSCDAGSAKWLQRFTGRCHAEEACRLRRWDDAGKVAGAEVPEFAHLHPTYCGYYEVSRSAGLAQGDHFCSIPAQGELNR